MNVLKVHLKQKSYTMLGGFDAFRSSTERQPPGNVSMGQFESVELSPEGIEVTTVKEVLWYPWGSVDHLTVKKTPTSPTLPPSAPAAALPAPVPYGVQALTDDREPVPTKKQKAGRKTNNPGIIEVKAA